MKYSDVPDIYWIKQRSGRDYYYFEQHKPDDPAAVPARIYTDPRGRSEVDVRIEEIGSVSPVGESATSLAAADPVGAKLFRSLQLRGILPYYLDEAAVKALFEKKFTKTANGYMISPASSARDDVTKCSADEAAERGIASGRSFSETDHYLTENIRFVEKTTVGKVFELIKHMLEHDEIVLDLEFGALTSQELRNFQHAIKWLRSLGIDLDNVQVSGAMRRLDEVLAKQIVDKSRASVDKFVLICERFEIHRCNPETVLSDGYDLMHVHVDSGRLGRSIRFITRLAKNRMHSVARQLCESHVNRVSDRGLMLNVFGTVLDASEKDSALDLSVNPIVIFR
ncbi:hypothetical protein [uncultured Thiodictyon sp.]|uniref:hypothetical protein n=1 Tax=uncultured Thiodictyon sp. TaxID=1846217 RepID=UPI0025D0F921|nr:hypothetical protein [uncultured Thiodictyon sp.]